MTMTQIIRMSRANFEIISQFMDILYCNDIELDSETIETILACSLNNVNAIETENFDIIIED